MPPAPTTIELTEPGVTATPKFSIKPPAPPPPASFPVLVPIPPAPPPATINTSNLLTPAGTVQSQVVAVLKYR